MEQLPESPTIFNNIRVYPSIMSWTSDVKKGLAQCTECGHPYVVAVHSDDSFQILGDRERCTCGSEEFQRIELSDLNI